jgi:hypothetical protein
MVARIRSDPTYIPFVMRLGSNKVQIESLYSRAFAQHCEQDMFNHLHCIPEVPQPALSIRTYSRDARSMCHRI